MIKNYLNIYVFKKIIAKFDLKQLPDLLKSNQKYNSDFVWYLYSINNQCRSKPFFKESVLLESEAQIKKIPITSLYGCNPGKSLPRENLLEFAFSLEKFPRNSDFYPLYFETENDFSLNCKSINERYEKPYTVYEFIWNNRKFLINSDQSHHIAAVYRQCIEQRRNYEISCALMKFSINPSLLNKSKRQYELFVVNVVNKDMFMVKLYEYRNTFDFAEISHCEVSLLLVKVRRDSPHATSIIKVFNSFVNTGKVINVIDMLRNLAMTKNSS